MATGSYSKAFGGGGWNGYGRYLEAKTASIKEQLYEKYGTPDLEQSVLKLFAGCVFWLDGRTRIPEFRLKELMIRHGGEYEPYDLGQATHVIADNLAVGNKRWKDIRDKGRARFHVVTSEWVPACVERNTRLPESLFLPKSLRNVRDGYGTMLKFVQPRKDSVAVPLETEAGVSSAAGLASACGASKGEEGKETLTLEPGNRGFPEEKLHLNNEVCMGCQYPIPAAFMKDGTNMETATALSTTQGMSILCTDHETKFVENFFKASRLHFIGVWRDRVLSRYTMIPFTPLPDAAVLLQGCNRSAESGRTLKDFLIPAFPGKRFEQPSINITASSSSVPIEILHVDFDAFFVSVALRKRPDLINQPVAVSHGTAGGTGARSSSEIASCNYTARGFGVKKGMYLGKALELCPTLVTLPYDFEAIEAASFDLFDVLTDVTARVLPMSCDEAYVQLVGPVETRDPVAVGHWIRENVFARTGCNVSVGIGPNLLLAKLAGTRAKNSISENNGPTCQKSGVYRVTPPCAQWIGPVPLADLPGIGDRLGLRTVEKLKAVDPSLASCSDVVKRACLQQLQKVLGKKNGETCYAFCHGCDPRPIPQLYDDGADGKHFRAMTVSVNWGIRLTSTVGVQNLFYQMAQEAERRLHRAGVSTDSIMLKILRRAPHAPVEPAKYGGCGECIEFTKRTDFFPPTVSAHRMYSSLYGLWERFFSRYRGVDIDTDTTVGVKCAAGCLQTFLRECPIQDLRGISLVLTKATACRQSSETISPISPARHRHSTGAKENLQTVLPEEIGGSLTEKTSASASLVPNCDVTEAKAEPLLTRFSSERDNSFHDWEGSDYLEESDRLMTLLDELIPHSQPPNLDVSSSRKIGNKAALVPVQKNSDATILSKGLPTECGMLSENHGSGPVIQSPEMDATEDSEDDEEVYEPYPELSISRHHVWVQLPACSTTSEEKKITILDELGVYSKPRGSGPSTIRTPELSKPRIDPTAELALRAARKRKMGTAVESDSHVGARSKKQKHSQKKEKKQLTLFQIAPNEKKTFSSHSLPDTPKSSTQLIRNTEHPQQGKNLLVSGGILGGLARTTSNPNGSNKPSYSLKRFFSAPLPVGKTKVSKSQPHDIIDISDEEDDNRDHDVCNNAKTGMWDREKASAEKMSQQNSPCSECSKQGKDYVHTDLRNVKDIPQVAPLLDKPSITSSLSHEEALTVPLRSIVEEMEDSVDAILKAQNVAFKEKVLLEVFTIDGNTELDFKDGRQPRSLAANNQPNKTSTELLEEEIVDLWLVRHVVVYHRTLQGEVLQSNWPSTGSFIQKPFQRDLTQFSPPMARDSRALDSSDCGDTLVTQESSCDQKLVAASTNKGHLHKSLPFCFSTQREDDVGYSPSLSDWQHPSDVKFKEVSSTLVHRLLTELSRPFLKPQVICLRVCNRLSPEIQPLVFATKNSVSNVFVDTGGWRGLPNHDVCCEPQPDFVELSVFFSCLVKTPKMRQFREVLEWLQAPCWLCIAQKLMERVRSAPCLQREILLNTVCATFLILGLCWVARNAPVDPLLSCSEQNTFVSFVVEEFSGLCVCLHAVRELCTADALLVRLERMSQEANVTWKFLSQCVDAFGCASTGRSCSTSFAPLVAQRQVMEFFEATEQQRMTDCWKAAQEALFELAQEIPRGIRRVLDSIHHQNCCSRK